MKRREYLSGLAGIGAVSMIGTTSATATQAGSGAATSVLTVQDPSGDNHGDGSLTRPTAGAFYEGAWDATEFRLQKTDSRVVLEFDMVDVQNPFDGSNGFSHEFFQIYIRDPNADSDLPSGTKGREALKANFEDPYHYRVAVHGWWGAVEDPLGNELSPDVQASVDGTTVTIDVPKSAVGGDPDDKELCILVCPQDGNSAGGLRVIEESKGKWVFGGGGSDTPKVVDMITPEGVNQSDALSNFGLGALELPYLDVDQHSGYKPGDSTDSPGDSPGNTPDVPDVGGKTPTNLDGDDLVEDVNGDGEGDLFDALHYYNNRDSAAITDNPTYFDFDGDGSSGDLFDALELFNQIK